jgi:hypothetical protein
MHFHSFALAHCLLVRSAPLVACQTVAAAELQVQLQQPPSPCANLAFRAETSYYDAILHIIGNTWSHRSVMTSASYGWVR